METFIEKERIEEEVKSSSENLILIPPSRIKLFLKSQKCYILSAFIVITLIMPVLMMYLFNDIRKFPSVKEGTCLVDTTFRVPCGKLNISSSACTSINCCYDDDNNQCFHYIPSAYNYNLLNGASLSKLPKNPFGRPIFDNVHITTKEIDENVVYISLEHKPQPPQTLNTPKKYYTKEYLENMAIEVYRDSHERILTTSLGPLIASQHYWEWTIQLTTNNLFGLGELLLNQTETITKIIYNNRNDHNTIPIFMAEQNGQFHGLHVIHNGPLEVSILPSKLIILKSLAGDQINLRLFLGPTPKHVMQQMRNIYFKNSPEIPRWVLGSHLCSDFYVPVDDVLKKYNEDYKNVYDSDCIHSNLTMLIYNNIKIDEIKNAVQTILKSNKKFILSLPPHIPFYTPIFKSSNESEVLFKTIIKEVWKGKAFNVDVGFVDFSKKNIMEWKEDILKEISKVIEVEKINGLSLIQNWPTDNSYAMPNSTINFPYLTSEMISAMSKTLPWNAENFENIKHIIIHNRYGNSQLKTMFNQNMFTMTSSYSLPLDEDDVNVVAIIENMNATWTNLKKMIKINLYHGLFANPLIATPVCGSNFYKNESTNKENICLRWYIVAATMPMLRATSDLSYFQSQHVKDVALDALKKREMLSYYYYNFISNNEPLARPMFYDFHWDNLTFALDEQYMVGDALLTAHPVVPNAANLRVYLPKSSGPWYEFFGGTLYNKLGWNNIFIVDSDWTMFIMAGTIIPLKNDKSFNLAVALNCTSKEPEGKECNAKGIIKFKSNLEIKANEKSITLSNIDAIKNEIGCSNGSQLEEIHPTIIQNLKLFGLKESRVVDVINIDLCKADNITEHTYTIKS